MQVDSSGSGNDQAAEPQTVAVGGYVDVRNVGELRLTLHTALDSGRGPLRVDVSALELGDDAALGVLLGAARRARRSGRTLVLANVPPVLAGMLRAGRLGRVLRVEDAGTPLGIVQA